jgi:hypothetical protein
VPSLFHTEVHRCIRCHWQLARLLHHELRWHCGSTMLQGLHHRVMIRQCPRHSQHVILLLHHCLTLYQACYCLCSRREKSQVHISLAEMALGSSTAAARKGHTPPLLQPACPYHAHICCGRPALCNDGSPLCVVIAVSPSSIKSYHQIPVGQERVCGRC